MDQALASPRTRGQTTRLLGRRREQEALAQLLKGAREGAGGSLVVHGEPGVGKTALLDDIAHGASDLQTVSAMGVEREMELPFGALSLVV